MFIVRVLTGLLRKLKDPRIKVLLVAVGLAVIAIRVGKRYGLRDTALTLFIIGIFVITLTIVIILTIKAEKKKKAAAQAEQSLLMEADSLVGSSSGAARQANETSRRELAEAIEALKAARTERGRSGRSALHDLPWYLVLGRPESGKSTMVRNSGLSVPGSRPEDRKRFKAVGPGHSAQWWFTNHAVILEANGRFVGAPDVSGENMDWEGVLEVLHKARSPLALNGIVVTLSMEDLIRHDSERLDDQARTLRHRLDTAVKTLEEYCPVYLVITKADRVHGFQEFFSDLRGNARDQLLGATLSWEQMEADDPAAAFAREFEALYQSLCRRRISRMEAEPRLDKRGPMYLFPLEFRSVRGKLHRFVRTLFEPNPYGEKPLFRGFYFTSGIAAGSSVEMVVNEVSRIIGLPPDLDKDSDVTRFIEDIPEPVAATPSTAPAGNDDPCFLRELFTRVLLRDMHMARPTEVAARRRMVQRAGLQLGGVGLLGVLAILLIISFARNHSLISDTVNAAGHAVRIPAGADDPGQLHQRLSQLEEMRDRLADLDHKDENGAPVTMRFGLYRGQAVNQAARNVYFERFVDIFLGPSRAALEKDLLGAHPGSPEEYDSYYRDYRAYRMLLEPEHAEAEFLADRLVDFWSRSLFGGHASDGLRRLVRSHLAYAFHHPGDIRLHSADQRGRNPVIVENARAYIKLYWTANNYYEAMIEQVNAIYPRFTIEAIPGASTLLYAESPVRGGDGADSDADAVGSGGVAPGAGVPGSFRAIGWDEISARIEESGNRILNDWVLHEAFEGEPPPMRDWLTENYARDYIAQWSGFLRSVRVITPSGVGEAAKQLQKVSSRNSPFVVLLNRIAANLRPGTETGSESDGSQLIPGVQDDFAALHLFLASDEDGRRPLDEYLEGLTSVIALLREQESGDPGRDAADHAKEVLARGSRSGSPLLTAMTPIEQRCHHIPGADFDCTDALLVLLRRPLEAAWGGVLGEAQSYLDGAWETQVWEKFNETLTGKFPFQVGGSDAALEEFNRLFAPRGAFWTFHDEELAPFLDASGEPQIVYGHGLELGERARRAIEKAREFREALYDTQGALGLTLRVKPLQTVRVSGTPPYANKTLLKVGATQLQYEMGSARSEAIPWPDADGAGDASVQVFVDGPAPGSMKSDGPWGLFRLLAQGTVAPETATRSRVSWRLEHASYAIEVPYEITTSSSVNPLRPGFLQFDCPRQIRPDRREAGSR